MYLGKQVKNNITFSSDLLLKAELVSKTFILHNQNKAEIKAVKNLNLSLKKGECLVLSGPSGAGKSSVLKLLYGTYRLSSGNIFIRHNSRILELSGANPHEILALRKETIGYVSQFLDIIPRISALEAVSEVLLTSGLKKKDAEEKTKEIFKKLKLPEKLWHLPPSTFSGGEKQRVNIARCFVKDCPIIFLDEPTASLDRDNIETVCSLIREKLKKNTGIIGIFHDEDLKKTLATKMVSLNETD
jgi:alpha-D-ribose 1-methylphosphonate 5-triphosphate synthase subunit PhnL